ncbi:MAG: T9SS type A sorting domain-containing protein [Bacteroidota bacterium]
MQRFILHLIKLSFFYLPLSIHGQIVISAVFDGPLTGGNPKGVELYVSEDIPDLSIYGIGSANNGTGTDGEEFTFPAVSATAGSYIYLNQESNGGEQGFIDFFGFPADYITDGISINGDDAIELFQNGVLFDLFGDQNSTSSCPPTGWRYADGWAARNDNVPPTTTFNLNDWTYSGCDALDGETSNNMATTPVPIGVFTLPVNLTAFCARATDAAQVALFWATSEEEGNDYFAIERSADGRAFTEIGQVSALGRSSGGEYDFLDTEPLSGTSYYRLRQVDIDGTTAYYGPRAVSFSDMDTAQVEIFPNPVSDWLTIQPISDGLQTVRLIDQQGRIVRQWNQSEFAFTDRLQLDDMMPGIYLLQGLEGDGNGWSKQIIVGKR